MSRFTLLPRTPVLRESILRLRDKIRADRASRSTSISGGIAIQAGFLVSFKQLVPEHTVSLFRSLIRIRVKHFPAIFLLANTISGIAFGTDTAMLLSWVGFMTSWTYLRFYRMSPSLSSAATSTPGGALNPADMIRGDASDTFAFAYFFPDVVHGPVSAAADAVYSALVALRVCSPFSADEVEQGNEQAAARGEGGALPSLLNHTPGAGPGSTRQESERRRALALRALDQRLQGVRGDVAPATQAATTSSPNPLAQTNYNPEADDAMQSQREQHGVAPVAPDVKTTT